MNKTLIVAALSAIAAGSALAQTSVTLYGRVNLSGERQDTNGRKIYNLADNSSRWGVKGSEDLGGGLRAGFQLESGFDASTGRAAASFFGRQSEVNLGGAFGTIRLGNFTSEAYYATADYISMHNHDTGSSSDALYAYIGRNTNKVAYRTPEFIKGMTIEGAVSAGEGAAGQKRSYDFAANYAIGKLALGAGYEKNNAKKQAAVRALYEFGPVVLGAYYQRDSNVYASGRRNTYRLAGAYNLGQSEFHLNFGAAGKYSGVANSSAKQWTVAYNYNLSKRTKLYTYYTKIDDSTAGIYTGGPRGAGRQGEFTSIAFGMRHNF